MDFFRYFQLALRRGWPPIFHWLMRRRIAMKQFIQKITAIDSALLIAFALAGLNTDQAVAKGKGGKGAKVRAGGGAILAPPGSSKNAVTAIFNTDLFRNVPGAEAELMKLRMTRRMKTYENVSDSDIAAAIPARPRQREDERLAFEPQS